MCALPECVRYSSNECFKNRPLNSSREKFLQSLLCIKSTVLQGTTGNDFLPKMLKHWRQLTHHNFTAIWMARPYWLSLSSIISTDLSGLHLNTFFIAWAHYTNKYTEILHSDDIHFRCFNKERITNVHFTSMYIYWREDQTRYITSWNLTL